MSSATFGAVNTTSPVHRFLSQPAGGPSPDPQGSVCVDEASGSEPGLYLVQTVVRNGAAAQAASEHPPLSDHRRAVVPGAVRGQSPLRRVAVAGIQSFEADGAAVGADVRVPVRWAPADVVFECGSFEKRSSHPV